MTSFSYPLYQCEYVFRPPPAPARYLPFGVRSVGHHRIKAPFSGSQKKIIDFVELFWCVRGEGIIELNNRRRVLKQHQVALYLPNMQHFWSPELRSWEFYYLTIDGPFAVFLPAACGLEADIYDVGPAPISLFKNLLRLTGHLSKQAEMRACLTALSIFMRAAGSNADQTDELVNMALKRMHKDYALPTLNIKTLADSLGIHRDIFCSRFYTTMGRTPGDYLRGLRIQKALFLLQNTHVPIVDIAGQCGFTDISYFSRVIRHTTGRSPRQFRGPGAGGK